MALYHDGYIPEIKYNSKADRAYYWEVAKGLQEVDGLTTSAELDNIASQHVEGKIDIDDAWDAVHAYYERRDAKDDSKEADLVSCRIVALLESSSFSYRPTELKVIHGALFEGVIAPPYDKNFRDFNISKKEPVLDGDTVLYSSAEYLQEELDYTFRAYDPRSFTLDEQGIKRFSRFFADMWQVHPFCEGNTRTCAVWAIKFLRAKGVDCNNDYFRDNARYFRDALVRANYARIALGIDEDLSFIVKFFENVCLGTTHDLRSRDTYCTQVFAAHGTPDPQTVFTSWEEHKEAES